MKNKKIKVKKQQAPHHLKGSAIGLSVIMALLIIAVCYFALLRSSYFRINLFDFETKRTVSINLESGKQLVCTDEFSSQFNWSGSLQDREDTVKVKRRPWGVYELGEVLSKRHKVTDSIAVLIGSKLNPKFERVGAYCPDRSKVIGVAGDSELHGINYFPEVGLQSKVIQNKFYNGSKLYFGELRISESTLPSRIDVLRKLTENITENIDFNENDEMQLSEYSNSFFNDTQIFSSDDFVLLENHKIIGNVIVTSKKGVHISDECILEDIIIYAPEIFVESGFKGNVQLWASESIEISDNVELGYPSSIVLLAKKKGVSIDIGMDSILEGELFCVNELPENLDQTILHFDKNVHVRGGIYCNGKAFIQGRIDGSAICRTFGYKDENSINDNVIFDLIVNPDNLSDYYLLSIVDSPNREILKRVN